jgi:hypothetical protein
MVISLSASLRLFRYGYFPTWNYACACSDAVFKYGFDASSDGNEPDPQLCVYSGTVIFRLGIVYAVVPVLFFPVKYYLQTTACDIPTLCNHRKHMRVKYQRWQLLQTTVCHIQEGVSR